MSIDARSGPRIRLGGEELVSFAGCDYLGLATHAEVIAALQSGAERCGVSASASPVTSGAFAVHREAEAALAGFLGCEDAVMISAGSLAADAVVEALADRVERWVMQACAHACIHRAARASGKPTWLAEPGESPINLGDRSAILSDAVFPVDGALADAGGWLARLAVDGWLGLDESHALGVLGRGGRGMLGELGHDRRVVSFGSLGKAIGCFGGYVAGAGEVCEAVRMRSETYITSTPVPPSVAAAIVAAIRVLEREPAIHARLIENTRMMVDMLEGVGLAPPEAITPIFTRRCGSAAQARELHAAFRVAGLLVPTFDYPGSGGAMLRWTVQSGHTREHLDAFADVARRELG